MEPSPSPELSSEQKAEALRALALGPLSSATAKLSASSRPIPSDKDFHFYFNFPEFKAPIKNIAEISESALKAVGSSSAVLFGKGLGFPDDLDDSLDWLVNVNDEILERFDVSVDEFRRIRKNEEETGKKVGALESEGGFQVVYGKKKKAGNARQEVQQDSSPVVKVASKDQAAGSRSKVPFHIPTIPRPQDKFNILVNNTNQPFQHVWLEKSEDGGRFIHPLEKFSELDFIDRGPLEGELVKPLPLASTPFKLVEEVKDLSDLANKLRDAKEFAVDLEHNQYRSFQGLTCLMQISTRAEDFVVDTLKLRVQVGPFLREVFKDPNKRKVMHGADRDILWLQRDFGIYVCNLFDTGQASRILQLERNSLEYLLLHFCEVTANKEYQHADWRLRPLPEEMIKYAREDTHYLLHIYDLMRDRLLAKSNNSDTLLLEVYKRSNDICIQLYEKELLTDTSYLHIYGLQGADFNSEQLAVVAGLCEWRDFIARAEDESTGFILPNKTLLEIGMAMQIPLSASKLHRLVKSKHPYVDRNIGPVINIIKSSVANSTAFQAASELLKEAQEEIALKRSVKACTRDSVAVVVPEDPMSIDSSPVLPEDTGQSDQFIEASERLNKHASISSSETFPSTLSSGTGKTESMDMASTKSVAVAFVQTQKKPNSAFGMMFGKSTSKRKVEDQAGNKLEHIKSSVSLPFHSFSGLAEAPKPVSSMPDNPFLNSVDQYQISVPLEIEEIMPLEHDSIGEDESREQPAGDNSLQLEEDGKSGASNLQTDTTSEENSLTELSSDFQDFFRSLNQSKNPVHSEKRQAGKIDDYPLFKPFDYAAARKQMKFGEVGDEKKEGRDGLKGSRMGARLVTDPREEAKKGFQQARRRQAFPLSGNRSATFRE